MYRENWKLKRANVFVVGVLLSTLFFLLSTQNSFSGEAIGSDKIKDMLLRPGGWLVEWRGASSGVNDFIFEARGDSIIVKIHNAAWNMSCERNVTIVEGIVKLDGCYDTNISLRYDPNDKEYPFKGESKNVNYKLKAK
jgi:hypothetical protein